MIRAIINAVRGSTERKVLVENFFSLSFLQLADYILPLITLPYLVRVLGLERFGLIIFAQAFIQFFVILTDFGFNLSATREISLNRDDRDRVSEIFCSVMLVKSALMMVSLAALAGLVFAIPKFRADWPVYLFTSGLVISNVLFPVWFFQGMEKMKYITLINILAKLIFVACIFIFIRNSADYIYVPLINSLGFIAAGILSFWIARKHFRFRLYMPGPGPVISIARESVHFLLSRVSVSIYTTSSVFFLGMFTSNLMVGYYSAAEKLYLAVQKLYHPLVAAVYPFMAKTRDRVFYKKMFKLSVLANTLFIALLFVFSRRVIILLFGSDFNESVAVLRIFSAALFVVVPSILLGYPFLAALGRSEYANNSVIIGSIFHLAVLVALTRVCMNIYTVAALVVLTESLVLLIRVYGITKYKLWRVR
ncbi:MAG: flippase [Candidatus Omnitrophica bacterium]|nr:flippase [Candidatus Omnitrophota bacterium]